MSILTVIDDACMDLGIGSPATVVNTSDGTIKQLLAIAQRGAKQLARRTEWEALLKTKVFTLATNEDQGHINDILMTTDFNHMINGTFLNDSTTLPITGPVSSKHWQQLQSFPVTGPYPQFRFQNSHLLVNPAPGSGETARFEYKSKHICKDENDVTKPKFTLDEDEFLLDEDLLTLQIIWMYRQRHGLAYDEDFNECERQIVDAMARDKAKKTLNMGASASEVQPGIFLPVGNWDVS